MLSTISPLVAIMNINEEMKIIYIYMKNKEMDMEKIGGGGLETLRETQQRKTCFCVSRLRFTLKASRALPRSSAKQLQCKALDRLLTVPHF